MCKYFLKFLGSLAASVKAASLSVDGHVTIDSNEFTKEFLETITFTYHGNIENIQSPRNYKVSSTLDGLSNSKDLSAKSCINEY